MDQIEWFHFNGTKFCASPAAATPDQGRDDGEMIWPEAFLRIKSRRSRPFIPSGCGLIVTLIEREMSLQALVIQSTMTNLVIDKEAFCSWVAG